MAKELTLPDLLANPALISEALDFVRAMRDLKVATANGDIALQWQPGANNAFLDLRSLTASGATPPGSIPSQTGNAGLVLGTDGATASWVPNGATLYTAVSRNATQSVNNGTFTTITWDTGDSNDHGIWNAGNPTRLTVPAGEGGLYFGYAKISYAANSNGVRYIYLNKNGAGTNFLDNQNANGSGVPTYKSFSFLIPLLAGDYLTMQAYQDSGGSLNISSGGACAMTLCRIGD